MKPANYSAVYCAALYPQLAEITRVYGYALAVHGSLARDFDVVCIPWTEEVSEPEAVIQEILKTFAIKRVEGIVTKEHGRMVQTLSIGFGECFVDMSFMPLARAAAQADGPAITADVHRGSDELPSGVQMAALKRFAECCEDSDSGGHDVPKAMVMSLCKLGALNSIGWGRYEATKYGEFLLERDSMHAGETKS